MGALLQNILKLISAAVVIGGFLLIVLLLDRRDERRTATGSPITPPYTPAQSRKGLERSFWDFKASQLITSLLTAALAVLGFMQWIVYVRQAKIMKDQTKVATAQTYIAANQANIAIEQNAIVRSQLAIMQADHRPWVSAFPINLVGTFNS